MLSTLRMGEFCFYDGNASYFQLYAFGENMKGKL